MGDGRPLSAACRRVSGGRQRRARVRLGPAARLADPAQGRQAVGQFRRARSAFLASDQSSFMLGANVYVDGGENQI